MTVIYSTDSGAVLEGWVLFNKCWQDLQVRNLVGGRYSRSLWGYPRKHNLLHTSHLSRMVLLSSAHKRPCLLQQTTSHLMLHVSHLSRTVLLSSAYTCTCLLQQTPAHFSIWKLQFDGPFIAYYRGVSVSVLNMSGHPEVQNAGLQFSSVNIAKHGFQCKYCTRCTDSAQVLLSSC